MKPTKFYQIGQVSKTADLPASTIRFWEKTFAGLKTIRSSGGHRYYSAEQVELIILLKKLLHEEGYTIEGAKKYLAAQKNKNAGAPPEQTPADSPTADNPNTNESSDKALLSLIHSELHEILDILNQKQR